MLNFLFGAVSSIGALLLICFISDWREKAREALARYIIFEFQTSSGENLSQRLRSVEVDLIARWSNLESRLYYLEKKQKAKNDRR